MGPTRQMAGRCPTVLYDSTVPDSKLVAFIRTHSTIRGWAIIAYLVAVVAFIGGNVPFDRVVVILVIIGALTVTNIGRPRQEIAQVLFDWIPFTFVLLAYDLSRGLAHKLARPVAYTPQITAEKWLFFGKLPVVTLQKHFWHHNAQWWDVVSSLIYVSHFIVPFVIAGLLWRRDWPAWRAYTTQFVTISFCAVVFFAAFPTAPPWSAAADKHLFHLELEKTCLPAVVEGHKERVVTCGRTHSTRGLAVIGLQGGYKLVDNGKASANPFAAIPSLHSAFAMLVAITMWPRTKRKLIRGILILYPIAMITALVYSGEHYVVDAIVGWLLVAAVAIFERRGRFTRTEWWDRVGNRYWPHAMSYLRPETTH